MRLEKWLNMSMDIYTITDGYTNAELKLEVQNCEYVVPFRARGTVDSKPFYFVYSYKGWGFWLSPDYGDPLDVYDNPLLGFSLAITTQETSKWPKSIRMPGFPGCEEELIEHCAREYYEWVNQARAHN